MKTFIVKTLGCKVNQYEGQVIKQQLENGGFREAGPDELSNLVVVNTCTVTGEADRKSRYEIRKFNRLYPSAKIVVTGCYAERQKDLLRCLPGVSLVVSQRQKDGFLENIKHLLGPGHEIHPMQKEDGEKETLISRFSGRGRAFIKVQDGCNMACTYCKVVVVRGRLRSRSPSSILKEARQLLSNGYRELVLTGIQLGAYGKENSAYPLLTALMRSLVQLDGLDRLRLSSINPYDITDELIELLAHEPKCCPHLHIPLQSGSNEVLLRMRRGYSREEYRERVKRLHEKVRNFSLTLDCMVGFPGEKESHFEETLDLLREVKPLKVHAFPYSRRLETRAAQFSDTIGEQEKRNRMERVLGLADELRLGLFREAVGQEVSFLVEEFDNLAGQIKGITSNYMPVSAPGEIQLIGRTVTRFVTAVRSSVLLAA